MPEEATYYYTLYPCHVSLIDEINITYHVQISDLNDSKCKNQRVQRGETMYDRWRY